MYAYTHIIYIYICILFYEGTRLDQARSLRLDSSRITVLFSARRVSYYGVSYREDGISEVYHAIPYSAV